MKKVIFISALAIAAAVSCNKSEIVDTKFNEQIGFENYLGRPAQTKATVATSFTTAGIYGFYTGSDPWGTDAVANLWVDDLLTFAGTVTPTKFWANADDKYSFLAYAPKGDANITNMPTGDAVANPTITFAVPTALGSQTDLLYASVIDVNKPANTGDKVAMTFHHALSRLTVNAKEDANQTFGFCVKKITIAGGFQKSAVLTLNDGSWSTDSATAAETETYTFYENADNREELSTTNTEYAKVGDAYSNYLMMIPVDFSGEGNAATLTVEYTTVYDDVESTVIKKTIPVTTDFEQGKAYSINLTFSKATEEIMFSVTVENWDENTTPQNETINA